MLFEYTHKTESNPFDLQSTVLFKNLLYGLSYIHLKTSTFLSSLLLLISSFQMHLDQSTLKELGDNF